MKNSLETTNWLENGVKEVHDMPRSHTEGLDMAQLEKLSLQDAAQEVGKKYFAENIQNSPGKLAAFRELEQDGGPEQFAKHYLNYMTKPKELKNNDSEMYEYMKNRVFHGREYPAKPTSQSISFTGSNEMVYDPDKRKGGALQ